MTRSTIINPAGWETLHSRQPRLENQWVHSISRWITSRGTPGPTGGDRHSHRWWNLWRVWGSRARRRSCGAASCVWPGTGPASSPPWKPSDGGPSSPPPPESWREPPGSSWVWGKGVRRCGRLASSPQRCHPEANLRKSENMLLLNSQPVKRNWICQLNTSILLKKDATVYLIPN